jgi:hypothetical protein
MLDAAPPVTSLERSTVDFIPSGGCAGTAGARPWGWMFGPRACRVDSIEPEGATSVSPFPWILLGVLYPTAVVVLGLATLRKGHAACHGSGLGVTANAP